MSSMNAVTAAVILAAMLASGCEGEPPSAVETEPENGESADIGVGHAGMTTGTDKSGEGAGRRSNPTVQLPKAVRERWSAVRLGIGDGQGDRETIRVPLGETVRLNTPGLSLRASYFLPAYTSDGSRITSRSNMPNNPAALVTIWRGDSQVDHGWVFRDLPQFNTLMGEVVDVELIAGEPTVKDEH